MKHLVFLSLFIISLNCKAQVDAVPNITGLEAYSGLDTSVYVQDTLQGGLFNYTSAALNIDGGVVFPATGKGSGYWQRNIAPGSALNLRWWGALGNGVSSLSLDAAALHNAFNYISLHGGGRLYVPNPPAYYAFDGKELLAPDHLEMYGDGLGNSEIRNVDASAQTISKGTIILGGTYGIADTTGLFQSGLSHYNIYPAYYGDTTIRLQTGADAAYFQKGAVIFYGAQPYGYDISEPRFRQGELNEITDIKHDTIYLAYPLTIDSLVVDGSSYQPCIVNINDNTTNSKIDASVTNFSSTDVYIHDMTLSQDAVPGNSLALASAIQISNGFQWTVNNVKMESYAGFSSNMLTRSDISNNTVISQGQSFDFGYNSSNNKAKNNTFVYKDIPSGNITSPRVLLLNDAHNIEYEDNNHYGLLDANALIRIDDAHRIIFKDNNFYYPKFDVDTFLISISDDSVYVSNRINFENNYIFTDSAGRFFQSIGSGLPGDTDRRNFIKNNVIISNKKAAGVYSEGLYVNNIQGLTFEDNIFPTATFTFQSSSKLNVLGFNSPAGILHLSGITNSSFDKNIFQSSNTNVPTNSYNIIRDVPYYVLAGTPTIDTAAGAGGSTATVSITGDDLSGYITLNTGAHPAVSSDVVIITFSNPLLNVPKSIVISPGNAVAAQHIGRISVKNANTTAGGWVLASGNILGVALTASTQYIFYYSVKP